MLVLLLGGGLLQGQAIYHSAPAGYLDTLKKELTRKWPHNRTLNLVFHGHSVPSGYLTQGVVTRQHAYPAATVAKLKADYPYAVLNAITTSIGGEHSARGALRFSTDVLPLRPDLVFIDYALNDRSLGLDRAEQAWRTMIEAALSADLRVVLMTPTPDLREDPNDSTTPLARHAEQIRRLATEYQLGLVDSYRLFGALATVFPLPRYMAQNNHVNERGHELVAEEIYRLLKQ